MNRLVGLVLAGSLLGHVSTILADHLPDNLQARGRPETNLAGINIRHAKLADIVRRYGQPTKVIGVEERNPKIASSYHYYWIRAGVTVHIVVDRFPTDLPNWQHVSLIEVGSGTSHTIGRTGKGLKLGDRLKELKRIYGSRYYVRDTPKFKIHDVMIQWHREEYSLVATLDRHKRITSLTLLAPE